MGSEGVGGVRGVGGQHNCSPISQQEISSSSAGATQLQDDNDAAEDPHQWLVLLFEVFPAAQLK